MAGVCDLSALASPAVIDGPCCAPSGAFSFIDSSTVLESAMLASGFPAVSVRSGFVFTGLFAKLSSSPSAALEPQHKNVRKPFFAFAGFVSVLGEPLSGVAACCCFSAIFRLLLALLALRFPVRLRFELFEPSRMLFDDPWTVSPLSPVFAEGKSSSVRVDEPGSWRLERFRRGRPSASTSRPFDDADPDRLSCLRFSLDSLLRDDLREGVRCCDDALEELRASPLSGAPPCPAVSWSFAPSEAFFPLDLLKD